MGWHLIFIVNTFLCYSPCLCIYLIYLNICMHVYIYTYRCIYTQIYIYTYIYTHQIPFHNQGLEGSWFPRLSGILTHVTNCHILSFFSLFPFLPPWLCSLHSLLLFSHSQQKNTQSKGKYGDFSEEILTLIEETHFLEKVDCAEEHPNSALMFLHHFCLCQKISLSLLLVDMKLYHLNQGIIHQGSKNHCAAASALFSYRPPESQ